MDNRIVQIFFRRLFYLGKKITLTLTPTVRKNFSNCTEKFFQLSGKIFPDSLLIFQNFSIFKFFFSNIFSVFSRFGKKSPENPKKHSVDIIVLYTVRRNSFSCNFDFSKLPRLKKGHLANIPKPRPSASASKTFYSLPFFQPR